MKIAYATDKPLLVWGVPGVGKSSVAKQVAADLNVQLLDWRLTMMEPVDMRGTPKQTKDDKTKWAPPAELPTDGEGILFLDELPQARTDTKNVAAMLVLERRIGEYQLPKGWRVWAAGNRETDNAGTTPMPKQLSNRFWHINYDLSHDDWLAWADEHDIDYRTYAYLKYRPGALLDFDPKSKDPAFATPRSWELVSDITKAFGDDIALVDAAFRAECFSGAVGKIRGAEYSGFLQVMDSLVSIEQVHADPANAPLPTDPSVAYALVLALAQAAERGNIDAALQYIGRLPQEFSVLAQHAVEVKQPALMKSKAFVALCVRNQGSI
jgi:MoxR-like ATPase